MMQDKDKLVNLQSLKVVYDTIQQEQERLNTAIATVNSTKQDKLTAGDNISIVGNVISSDEKNYELVRTIVTESATDVKISSCDDGTPFEFDGLYVEISGETVQTSWKQWIASSLANNHSGTYRLGRSYSRSCKNPIIHIELSHGLWIWRAYQVNSQGTATVAPYVSYWRKNQTLDKIRYLYLAGVVSGTTIKVYALK